MLSLHAINALDEEQFTARLGPLFEGSPWIARATWAARPFASLAALHAALVATVQHSTLERKLALVRAHPDLAGRAAIAKQLTPESTREQASAGLDRLTPDEFARFTRLNAAYAERFGFPFVICVREHDKHGILAAFERRLANERDAEVETALAEIAKIAWLRLNDLVADASGETVALGSTSYGKSAVRLVKVARGPERHELWDLNVDIALEGDFAAAYTTGDNTRLLATDTMRNAVYALAKDHPLDSIESFALALARHHLAAGPTVTGARVRIVQYPWSRIEVGGVPHEHAFTRDSGERVAIVDATAAGAEVQAGIDNLLILKTTASGWENFHRDVYTTLPDATDRILATNLTATWTYKPGAHDFTPLYHAVRARILETFTDHYSPSVQNTLYRIGHAVLQAFPQVRKIHFALPNKHHLLFNLAPFGLANHNEIFHVTSEPYGLIEGTVERREASQ
jgi:urate oxidase